MGVVSPAKTPRAWRRRARASSLLLRDHRTLVDERRGIMIAPCEGSSSRPPNLRSEIRRDFPPGGDWSAKARRRIFCQRYGFFPRVVWVYLVRTGTSRDLHGWMIKRRLRG